VCFITTEPTDLVLIIIFGDKIFIWFTASVRGEEVKTVTAGRYETFMVVM
jgi:hypothetical protein